MMCANLHYFRKAFVSPQHTINNVASTTYEKVFYSLIENERAGKIN